MSEIVQDGQFVGRVRADRAFGGLTLAETEYRPGLVVPAHAHSTGLISVVLDGSMTEQRGRIHANCESGSLIFQPQNEPHGHRFHEGGARCFVVQFGAPWTERMRALGLDQPDVPVDLRRTRANWLAGQLHREFRTADAAAELAIEGFALALLGEIGRARTRSERSARPPWLVRAVEMLHANLTGELSMAEIAAAAGVHPVHLSRTFRQHYGMTMGEYARRARIERARDVLLSTDLPLTRIALDAGFSDQAHFSRVFKQVTGQTPGAFRRAAGSGTRG